jgi:serine/threonine-protein kinase
VTQPNANPQAYSPAADKNKLPRRLDDYELLRPIGEGAMGAVYLARQISQNRQVALKLLPKELALDQEFVERFKREARASQKISHPNIVAAYQVGFAQGQYFIAFEYVDGPDLDTILAKRGFLPEKEVLNLALALCGALEAAHAMGIAHRDIKPSNILISSKGVPKLIDLGLSSASQGDRRVTLPGFAVGTPYYISPEQARGMLNADARVDFYGLGATLYHLATGKLPFPGNNAVVIMTKHIRENPAPPHEQNPAVSRPLSALIQKLMSKNPAGRPQNAQELRTDIENCMQGQAPILRIPAHAPAPAMDEGQPAAEPAKPLDERIFDLVDEIFSFAPKFMRVPLASALCTLLVLALLVLLAVYLRHS